MNATNYVRIVMTRAMTTLPLAVLLLVPLLAVASSSIKAGELPFALQAIADQAEAETNRDTLAGVYRMGLGRSLWLTQDGLGVLKSNGSCCSQGCFFPEPNRLTWQADGDWIELEFLPCLDCLPHDLPVETQRLLRIMDHDRTFLVEEEDLPYVANELLAHEVNSPRLWVREARKGSGAKTFQYRLPEQVPDDLAALMIEIETELEVLSVDDQESALAATGRDGYVQFSVVVAAGSTTGLREGLVYHWSGPDEYVRTLSVSDVDTTWATLEADLSVFDTRDREFMLRPGDRLQLAPPSTLRPRDGRVLITGVAESEPEVDGNYAYLHLTARHVGGTHPQSGDWLESDALNGTARVEAIRGRVIELRYRFHVPNHWNEPGKRPHPSPNEMMLVGQELSVLTRLH